MEKSEHLISFSHIDSKENKTWLIRQIRSTKNVHILFYSSLYTCKQVQQKELIQLLLLFHSETIWWEYTRKSNPAKTIKLTFYILCPLTLYRNIPLEIADNTLCDMAKIGFSFHLQLSILLMLQMPII